MSITINESIDSVNVAVLYARADSVYKTLPGVDVWDAGRDARKWPGGCPVVAHPPCRAWGRFRQFAKPREGERALAVDAVSSVRRFGGVLEHPAESSLWSFLSLPRPGAVPDEFGGWTLAVNQFHFGHKAAKPTWLYIVGKGPESIPRVPVREGRPTHVIRGSSSVDLPTVSHKVREATPTAFARWLVELAVGCRGYRLPRLPVYRTIVRDFGNGQAEVCTHLIRKAPGPEQLRDRDAAAAGIPITQWHKDRLADRRAAAGDLAPSESDAAASVERSVRRAKQNVRWRVKGQALDHLLTLTVRDNLTDFESLKKVWARFVRSVKEKSGDKAWPYVAAVEAQERGALHIHVAVKGRQDVNKLRGLWWVALGVRVKWSKGRPSCLADQTPGNIDVRGPKKTASKWRGRSLASYLAKYIGKELAQSSKNARRYWAPTGFVVPRQEVFLAAGNFMEAMLETALLLESVSGVFGSPWKSPDWCCIWVST